MDLGGAIAAGRADGARKEDFAESGDSLTALGNLRRHGLAFQICLESRILRMGIPALLPSLILIAAASSIMVPSTAHSQDSEGSPKQAPYFLNLYPPVYPPLARQARIMGDVVIQIGVRPDGSVASAEVISGHPMLRQAALDSARKSTFLRQEGSGGITSYSLTYTFGFRTGPDSGCTDGGTFARAAKCLYLWRCEWRNGPAILPAIGESRGHAIILAPEACVEAVSSRSTPPSAHLE